MDEVDGMSAGDRGGVGALAALVRKTKVRAAAFAETCDAARGLSGCGADPDHLHRERGGAAQDEAARQRDVQDGLSQVRRGFSFFLFRLCGLTAPASRCRPDAAMVRSRIMTIAYKCVLRLFCAGRR
jgi:hypothetical protein